MRTCFRIPAYISLTAGFIAASTSAMAAGGENMRTYQGNASLQQISEPVTSTSKGLTHVNGIASASFIDPALEIQTGQEKPVMLGNNRKTVNKSSPPRAQEMDNTAQKDDDC